MKSLTSLWAAARLMGEAVGVAPVAGLILHLAGPSDRGVHSLDIWESKEDGNRFWTEIMVPGLRKMGFEDDGPPLSFREYELPYVLGRWVEGGNWRGGRTRRSPCDERFLPPDLSA